MSQPPRPSVPLQENKTPSNLPPSYSNPNQPYPQQPTTSESFTPLSKDQLNLLQQPQASITLFDNQPSSPTNFNLGPATLEFHESNLNSTLPPPRAPSPLDLEREIRNFSAGDTLDEPIRTTLLRDLSAIWQKLKRVCFPKGRSDVLRDWDLWGPLLLCLGLSLVMSISAAPEDTINVFTSIFVIVWAGAGLVTLNTKLLGGIISFFQSLCVLGYCLFPLFLAAVVSVFFPFLVIRGVTVILAFLWATYASVSFLNTVNLTNRRALAVYPIYMFYFIIAWMILINKPSTK